MKTLTKTSPAANVVATEAKSAVNPLQLLQQKAAVNPFQPGNDKNVHNPTQLLAGKKYPVAQPAQLVPGSYSASSLQRHSLYNTAWKQPVVQQIATAPVQRVEGEMAAWVAEWGATIAATAATAALAIGVAWVNGWLSKTPNNEAGKKKLAKKLDDPKAAKKKEEEAAKQAAEQRKKEKKKESEQRRKERRKAEKDAQDAAPEEEVDEVAPVEVVDEVEDDDEDDGGGWAEIGVREVPAPREAANYYQEHITGGHARSATKPNKGRFNTDVWSEIKGYIDVAKEKGDLTGPHNNVSDGHPKGRFEMEFNFKPHVVGTRSNGTASSRVRVIVTRTGKSVVTAYPY